MTHRQIRVDRDVEQHQRWIVTNLGKRHSRMVSPRIWFREANDSSCPAKKRRCSKADELEAAVANGSMASECLT